MCHGCGPKKDKRQKDRKKENMYTHIANYLECKWTVLQPKDRDWLNEYNNNTCIYVVYKRLTSDLGHIQSESEGMEEDIP